MIKNDYPFCHYLPYKLFAYTEKMPCNISILAETHGANIIFLVMRE
jgi:hypothetical protein